MNSILDIIIPTYNNQKGLETTLNSIDTTFVNNQQVTVTIIDDASNMRPQLNDFPANLWLSDSNSGPGMARQIGIVNTEAPFFLFIDTGDTLLPHVLERILNDLQKIENNNINIFNYGFLINDKSIVTDQNNHLHGKIYRRSFIDQYNICFCPTSSYANEDIGFNHLCRLILEQYYNDQNTVLNLNFPIVYYDTSDPNSLSRKDGKIYIYKQQNLSLGLNAIHVIKIAQQNHVDLNKILDYINTIICSNYYYFILTIEERPEFARDAWHGAKYFYDYCAKDFIDHYNLKIDSQTAYSRIIKHFTNKNITWKPRIPLNFIRYFHALQLNNDVPAYYLT